MYKMGLQGFPGGSVVKNPPANAGDTGLIPGLGRSPGEGYGNPLQYSCLRIPWTEEPGGLQSMGSQTVRHNWVTNTIHTHMLANKALKKKKNSEGIISPHSRLIFFQLTVIKTVGFYLLLLFVLVNIDVLNSEPSDLKVNVSHSVVSDCLWPHGL